MATALIRTVILYFSIMAALRLTGKRQIGELEPSELVLTMMLSDLAAVPMQDFGIPLLAGHVKQGVYRWLWGQDSFMSADRWGCGSTLFIVRPEASQHWSLQALGGAQAVTSGELTPVNALGASVTGFLASAVSHRGRLPPLEKAPSSAVGSAVTPRESQCSALGLGCVTSVRSPSGVSVPQSLELPLEPRGLQSQTLGAPPPSDVRRQAEGPDVGLRALLWLIGASPRA